MAAADYRLGLDLGTNSIGWCAVQLDEAGNPSGVLGAGVRILTPNEEAGRDPQSKASLAASRRAARSARRRRDRFVRRRERLVQVLVKAGLLPEDRKLAEELHKFDPYWLRAAALDQRLEPWEIGRAIFHLNQRRGFKSNRVADAADDERGAVKAGSAALAAKLVAEQARTLGELLARLNGRDKFGRRLKDAGSPGSSRQRSVRFRPRAQGSKNLYDLYPTRDMLADELNAIWLAQQQWHGPELLSPETLQRVRRIVIDQRPLKKPLVGRCTLSPDPDVVRCHGLNIDRGERAPKAHPLFQRFRILQDVCQLRVLRPGLPERALTVAERNAIADVLMSRASCVAFERLQQAAGISEECRFNHEGWGRTGLDPDETAARLAKRGSFGPGWRKLDREQQVEVVERLLAEDDEVRLLDWLTSRFELSRDQANAVANVRLPQGHCRFGRTALSKLVFTMEHESRDAVDKGTGEIYERPLTYDEAVSAMGHHHSDRRPESKLDRLPYYGSALPSHVISWPGSPEGSQENIGRVPNPTVHIGMNQLRAVVNALIETYGRPGEIVVELARELKLSAQRKRELQRRQNDGRKRNEAFREELARLGLGDTYRNRLLLRLYEELPADERVCVYSGSPISKSMLFREDVEIDHVLPHSRTLDDSFWNKVLCLRAANQQKGNQTPAEAWSEDELSEIGERAGRVVPAKAWRFAPDALERVGDEGGDLLSRHLRDTQHLSRLAKTYLELVCGKVRASPGRLTAMLRAKWGLNGLLSGSGTSSESAGKNRLDHRHHAVDAFVLACTDKGLLQRVSKASGRAEKLDLDRLYPKCEFPEPFKGYRQGLAERLGCIVVSHKPDHGIAGGRGDLSRSATSGRLLEDTAYGLVEEHVDGKDYNLVSRKPLISLKQAEVDRIRDPALRRELRCLTEGCSGAEYHRALESFSKRTGVRRVRILKSKGPVQVVRHGRSFEKAYLPGDNHRIEIYETPDGKWRGEAVSVFAANQAGYESKWRQQHTGARIVMVVHKGDLIEADFKEGDGRIAYRVVRLEASANRLRLAPHFAATADGEFRKAYSRLKAAGARLVRVDAIGRVRSASA